MRRIERARQHLTGVDCWIIDNPVDLYYLTGLDLSLGRLLLSKEGAKLYVDGRYYEQCRNQKSDLDVVLLSRDAPFPRLEGRRIGFDATYTTVEEFEKLKLLGGELISLSAPLRQLRAIKEPEEIERLREVGELGSCGFDFVVSRLKEGVTEREIASELEIFWLREGGERLAFSPHIAFGEGSAHPHYHAGDRALKRGDVVLIDIGVVRGHYHSDMTRVVFFGEPERELVKIYSVVKEAQERALALCKPGVTTGDLDRVARSHIESAGYGELFPHSLGHGVGLEIHELPWIRKGGQERLEEGMVLTVEPGIYLPGLGGVRLEDTVVITTSGHENFTRRQIPFHPVL